MSRAQRLLQLLEALRRRRTAVTGEVLARELGISLRSLYRDIATLRDQGAHIEGESGMGYVLRPGFLLPPLMFSEEELEALWLGMHWVAERITPRDRDLGEAAQSSLAKIRSVLTPELRNQLDLSTLLIAPETIDLDAQPKVRISDSIPKTQSNSKPVMSRLRGAIRSEKKLRMQYSDAHGTLSERTVWPFGMGFFQKVQVLLAWCEERRDFRHFRVDRIASLKELATRYPASRQSLMSRWQESESRRKSS